MKYNPALLSAALAALMSTGCGAEPKHASKPGGYVQSVAGKVEIGDLGVALSHEHVLVDFIGSDRVSPDRYNADEAFDIALPFLLEAKDHGVNTLFECTPNYLGRDVALLRRLSEASGIHLVTNTGLYGAAADKFIPEYAFGETAEALARRWIDESRNGIGDTNVRPGFIKCGVDAGPELSDIDQKLIRAAALTHLETGLTIAVHTGKGPGLQELDILRQAGVSASAWIWVHAQNAPVESLREAAGRGAWISLDGLKAKNAKKHLDRCLELKKSGFLDQLLLSHDSGWYRVGEPNGGNYQGYTYLFSTFLDELRGAGFSELDIEQVLVTNPARAFAVAVRTN